MATKSKAVKFALGKLIRDLRKAKKMTLEQLCTGDSFSETDGAICDAGELGKYERGERTPQWDRFEKIMQRLGEDPSKYYQGYAITPKDKELAEKKRQLKRLLRKDKPENETKNIEQAEVLVTELENDKYCSSDKHNKQVLLYAKAMLAYYRKEYHDMYNHAFEGIQITKPLFQEDNIDTYSLFFDEILLINLIGIALFYISTIEKSTDVFKSLLKCLDNGYVDEDEKSKTYIRIMFNLSNNLAQSGQYEECINVCEVGVELCEKQQHSYHLPLFLFNQGACLMFTNQKKEGISILKDTRALFKAHKRFNELSHLDNFAKENFDVEMSYD